MIVILFFSSFLSISLAGTYNVFVNNIPVGNLSDNFLSITLDTGNSKSLTWGHINFTFLTPLTKALSPTYLRFGGSDADNLVFQENVTNENNFFNFYGQQLDELYSFANSSGLRLIFDLNLALRSNNNSVNGTWNATNPEQIINYASSKGYDMDFELGNEPDYLYFDVNDTKILNGSQIADDYRQLRGILNSNSLYKNSKLFGPSVVTTEQHLNSRTRQMMTDFLNNGGGNYVDALTFHYYYAYEGATNLTYFLNVSFLDWYLNVLDDYKSLNHTPLAITETSSAWGGGKANLSDTYAAGFPVWLDKLGLSALNGLSYVARQDIWGGNYALLDNYMLPLPDYWLSLLYKKLVGTQVYNVTFTPSNPNLRIYAASTHNPDGIVVYGQTMSNDTYTLDFPQSSNKQATIYILKEGSPGNLLSKLNSLNGNLIEWASHQPGPLLYGNVENFPVTIPGYSQFFVVIGQNPASQCPEGWYKETTSNKCIKIVTNTQILFSAQLGCAVHGFNTSLLSIDSAFENAEILKQTESTQCTQFLFGLIKNGTNYAWTNGDSTTYRNWKNGFPTSDPTQNCVTFDSIGGTWSNSDCDQPQCYICQKNI